MKQVALITGASAGIGKELARKFAKGGHDLVLVARRVEQLQSLAAELAGVTVHVFPADLSQPNAVVELIERLKTQGMVVETLVNNAGFGALGPFAEIDPKRQLDMVQVNVTALMHLTGLLLPGMLERKSGRILNVASTAAFQPGPFMAVYYATKAFVLHFSEALSLECRGTGVSVTTLCPGPTKTEFMDAAGMRDTPLFKGRGVMTAEKVAEVGFRATMAGKRLAVPGFVNKLLIFGLRFTPRWLVLRVIRRLQMKRKG